MNITVETILSAERVRWRLDFGRRDRSEGGSEGGGQTSRRRVEAGGIGILVRLQVTPRWADDPVQRHAGYGGVGERGGCHPPPRREISHQEEREGMFK